MKYLYVICLSLSSLIGIAQPTSGSVEYIETIKIEIDLPEEIKNSGIKVPESSTQYMELHFDGSVALYKTQDVPDNGTADIEHEGEGFQFKMKFSSPDNVLYTNLEDRQSVNQQEFMGKMFLIKGVLPEYRWKITNEQKQMDDYLCIKAIHSDTSKTIEAWFTPQIPVSTGPGNLGGLPGLILEADIDGGQTLIQVNKVSLGQTEGQEILPPTKGKELSKEAFEQIVEEKTQEMKEMHGGSSIKVIQKGG